VKDAYGFICMTEYAHSVVLIDKTFKIPSIKPSGLYIQHKNAQYKDYENLFPGILS
jgi:hypothetical protein